MKFLGFFTMKGMIPSGDHIRTQRKKIFHRTAVDTVADGTVFPVDDQAIGAVFLFQAGQPLLKRFPPALGDHVTQTHHSHFILSVSKKGGIKLSFAVSPSWI